ncbi:MAG: hypothetical protein LUG16_01725 [Candidatus Gastranaerophilales bacterium]|nr:hypothetical protein [Candidatus Gastranaerophilales bacterium]
MNVNAVGFLFADKIKTKGLAKANNYTCTILKQAGENDYLRKTISAPIIKNTKNNLVSSSAAKSDVYSALDSISKKNPASKFVGATIKDGVKETETHSLLSDKLYAVRTKDENGKNHFRILTKNGTKKLLEKNLNITA